MEHNALIRPIGLAAAILGIVEGLGWSLASIYGLIIQLLPNTPELSTNYGSQLLTSIYFIFMHEKTNEVLIMTNTAFLICMILQIIFAMSWFCISIILCIFINKKNYKQIRVGFIAWASITALLSILDICATIILAIDYSYVLDEYSEGRMNDITISAIGVVMTLAAKGFILLIINLIFTGIVSYLAFILQKETNQPRNNNYINAFQHSVPRTVDPFMEVANDEQPTPKFVHMNGGYIDDYGNTSPLARSKSFQYPPRNDNYYNYTSSSTGRHTPTSQYSGYNSNPSSRPSLAKIGKGSNNPILNKVAPPRVPAPSIPNPDYTPPASPSPVLKSVLKSNNAYY